MTDHEPGARTRGRNDPLSVLGRRLHHRLYERLTPLMGRANPLLPDGSLRWMKRLPLRPAHRRGYARVAVWPEPVKGAPSNLRTVAGVQRDPVAEQAAFQAAPLHDFIRTHFEALGFVLDHLWGVLLPTAPRVQRSIAAISRADGGRPSAPPAVTDPAEISALIKAQVPRVGLSAVGFTRRDPKYTLAEYQDVNAGYDNAIVCVAEQDWAATQTAPSLHAERAAFVSYADVSEGAAKLAEYIQGLGYRARPHSFIGETIVIHHAVQAGLGQLGLNGQLLTPQAGSRARILVIATDAPLVHDEPVDYGVHAVCDTCQICVKRCPVGAIPRTRTTKRGVVKAPIKPERCLPVVAQVHGCSVCMKVCPVQRYGLDAVKHHLAAHGEILGKDTDELEGYPWPVDGRYYGAGDKPRIDSEALLHPDGWHFDATRTKPPVASA